MFIITLLFIAFIAFLTILINFATIKDLKKSRDYWYVEASERQNIILQLLEKPPHVEGDEWKEN